MCGDAVKEPSSLDLKKKGQGTKDMKKSSDDHSSEKRMQIASYSIATAHCHFSYLCSRENHVCAYLSTIQDYSKGSQHLVTLYSTQAYIPLSETTQEQRNNNKRNSSSFFFHRRSTSPRCTVCRHSTWTQFSLILFSLLSSSRLSSFRVVTS